MDTYSGNSTRTAGENVQVLVRCRPLNDRELNDKQSSVVRCFDAQKQIQIQPKGSKVPSKTFHLDSVFGPDKTQRDLFQSSILPIIDEVLNGYNCTIFAYGTTGTGKTFTMEGPPGSFEPLSSNASAADRVKSQTEAGIISRSVHEIFDRLGQSGLEHSVRVSHLELYNEDLCDLLSPSTELQLKLLEDPRLGVQVHNLAELPVENPQDIFNVLQKSYTERRTAETCYNKHSSRSHCVFSITIHIKESTTEGEDLIKVGKLNLVDLAGSENIGRSGADRDVLRKQEAGNINKSLLTLGRVITALTEGQQHIPYRESKLTRLLQDSLGGRTKTCIIATISPSSGNVEETMSTLEYACRAKNIKNRPEVNQKMAKREVIKEYTTEIQKMRDQLDCMRRKDGVYLPTEEYDRMIRESKEFAEQVALLEESIKAKERQFEELQEVFDRLSIQAEKDKKKLQETETTLEKTKETLHLTTNTLTATRVELDETKHLVTEHEMTETALTSEAGLVLSELHLAIDDTEGLHAKISRKSAVDAVNEDRTSNLRQAMMSGLNQAELELRTFSVGVSQALAAVDGEIRESLVVQQHAVSQVSRGLLSIQEEHASKTEEMGKSVAQIAAAGRERLGRVSSATRSFLDRHGALQSQHTDSRARVWKTIDETKHQHKEALDKWSARQITSFQLQAEHAAEHSGLVAASLAQMDDHVTHFTADQNAQLITQETALEAFMAKQLNTFDTFRTSFLASVTSVLDDFIGQQLMETKDVLDGVRSKLLKEVQNADKFKQDFSKWSTQETQKIAAFTERTTTVLSDWKREVCEQLSAHESHESDVKLLKENLISLSARQTQAEFQHYQAHAMSIEASCTEMVEAENALELDVETRLMDMNEKLAETRSSLSETLTEHQEHLNRQANVVMDMISATKEAVEVYESETVEGTQEKLSRISAFSFESYKATGATPVKHAFRVPTSFISTKPHEELLMEYRAKQGYESRVAEIASDVAYLTPAERPMSPKVGGDALTAHGIMMAAQSVDLPLNHSTSSENLRSLARSPDVRASQDSLNTSTGSLKQASSSSSSSSSTLAASAPKQAFMIVNGQRVPQTAKPAASASVAAPAAKKTSGTSSTTSRATTNAASTTSAGKATAAAKKTTTGVTIKKAPSSVSHGPPLSEVTNNRS